MGAIERPIEGYELVDPAEARRRADQLTAKRNLSVQVLHSQTLADEIYEVMDSPPIPYPRAALDAVVEGMCTGRRWRWISGPAGVYREALPRPWIRITYDQARELERRYGVYEWGGPTGARPGRCWLTAHPAPWQGAPRCKWRRGRLMLAVVTDYADELGYLNFFWALEIIGDALVLAVFAWLAAPRPERCLRCAVARCLGCSWAERRRRTRPWSCACAACWALPPASRPAS